MPIYEYRCSSCGTEFEKLVRASDTPQCPSCHGQALDKKLSVFAVGVDSCGVPRPSLAPYVAGTGAARG